MKINNTIKIICAAVMLLPLGLKAQITEPQRGDTTYYKSLIPEVKQGLLKNMSMIANMRYGFRNEFNDGEYTQSRFTTEQFRLEFKGMIHDKVYFRFRDRYTRSQDPQSIDGISRSVDLAFIRVDVSSRLSLSAGKMCADWGAFEFDYNPIDIYEYSDIIEYADNFLSGVGLGFKANDQHQFTAQVLDSRTKSFEELYGSHPELAQSKAPLAYVLNWRGSLFNGKFNTIWSYALHNEAKDTATNKGVNMNYIALGNQVKLGKLTVEYDFKWSDEALDRTTIVSETIPDSLFAYSVQKTVYIGHWLHLYYRVSPKVNIAFIAMLDIANWNNSGKDPENLTGEKHIRDAIGFIPTIEYYPFKDLNLRFYANWVGRSYTYSDYAKSRFGAHDYSTGRFTIGFVSPLGIF